MTSAQRTGAIAGDRLPAGLKESDRLPQAIFTPATKALTGHDENISRAELARRTGEEHSRNQSLADKNIPRGKVEDEARGGGGRRWRGS